MVTKAEYMRAYRQKNSEKIKAQKRASYERLRLIHRAKEMAEKKEKKAHKSGLNCGDFGYHGYNSKPQKTIKDPEKYADNLIKWLDEKEGRIKR